MAISKREIRLVFAAGICLLGALTWVIVKKQKLVLENAASERLRLQVEELNGMREIMKEGDLVRDLAAIKQQLPRHQVGKDVTSELSQQLQSMASAAGLELTAFKPEREEAIPEIDLYQMSIRCNWQGAPQTLISFLYQLQSLGPVMDVQDLKLKTAKSRPGEWMTGSFIVDCAYSRFQPEAPSDNGQPLNPEATAPMAAPTDSNASPAIEEES